MDFIQKTNTLCLISPKLKIQNIIQFKDVNKIFDFYFLSPDNNCPLFSGIYLKSTSYLKENHILDNVISGKYADVQFVSRLLLNSSAYLFNLPYLNYIEHDSNDNKTPNLKDRIELSNYIRENSGFSNYIISLLVFHGYKEKRNYFILGLFLAFLYPPITLKLINKSLNKVIK
jgi:hypothetical protein